MKAVVVVLVAAAYRARGLRKRRRTLVVGVRPTRALGRAGPSIAASRATLPARSKHWPRVQDAVAADKLKGDISGAKAAEILSDVAGVSSHLDLVSSTTIATTTTPSSTTPDTRPRPRKHGGKGKGDENG